MSDKDIQLSRRKVLAGLGTIGIASAGAGLGTTAWLSDQESFLNNVLTAGTLDLIVDYSYMVDQDGMGPSDTDGYVGGINNGGEGEEAGGNPINFVIDDIKPGDSGKFEFCFRIYDNPAYLWACGEVTANDENGYTEPEMAVDDTEEGELAESIEATAYYCDSEGEPIAEIMSGSLADVVVGMTYSQPLDSDLETAGNQPFAPGDGTDNPCICINWEVPSTVGNEIQGDSLEFNLAFHAVQARHNPNGGANPCATDGLQSCVEEGDELPVTNNGMMLDATNDGTTTTFTLTVPDGIFPDDSPDKANHAELFLGTGASWETQVRYASGTDANIPIAGGSYQENGGSWQALTGDWDASAGDDVVTFTVPNAYLREMEICSLGVAVTEVDGDAGSTTMFLTPGGGRPWNGDMYVL